LALSLWDTGNIDAQFLATLLIQPKTLSADEMKRMVRSVTFVRVADWLNAYVVRQHPDKEPLRKRAIAIGEQLGIYRDYPVSKGCTSPFAPIWINAMVSRQG
jgi:3-methyladenine DNA glycosylase AlkD